MAIKLYELAGGDPARRFSPYCWRTRFALAHKGFAFTTVPWRFSEREKLAFSGQARVPVIRDGKRVVADSWAIAEYLDDTYPERPDLFGAANRAHARFINAWADTIVLPAIARLVVRDIVDLLGPEDAAYFRASREKLFGTTLEKVVAGREERVEAFRALLVPVRRLLATQEFLGGAEGPDYADYILAGTLMWPRCVSRFRLLEDDDPVALWFARVRALFDGMAEHAEAA